MIGRLEVNGTELAYREEGEGPLAIFVHGFPFDHTMWLDQVVALGEQRRCVAVDLRGFGASAALTEDILSMEVLAADLAALIGGLGAKRADVVALSMGGYAALALWELYPEVVRSLALVDTRPEADTPEGKQRRDEMARHTLERGREWLADTLTEAILAPGASLSARARLRSMTEGTRYETIVAALAGMRERPDRRFLLHSISVPTLVVVGEQDRLTPLESARAMSEEIPGSRLVVIPEAGHLTPVERPADVSEALADFLPRGGSAQ
ncbi:MAG: alpha/beta fold hydrolase [Acidimicrobiia bacterium]